METKRPIKIVCSSMQGKIILEYPEFGKISATQEFAKENASQIARLLEEAVPAATMTEFARVITSHITNIAGLNDADRRFLQRQVENAISNMSEEGRKDTVQLLDEKAKRMQTAFTKYVAARNLFDQRGGDWEQVRRLWDEFLKANHEYQMARRNVGLPYINQGGE